MMFPVDNVTVLKSGRIKCDVSIPVFGLKITVFARLKNLDVPPTQEATMYIRSWFDARPELRGIFEATGEKYVATIFGRTAHTTGLIPIEEHISKTKPEWIRS